MCPIFFQIWSKMIKIVSNRVNAKMVQIVSKRRNWVKVSHPEFLSHFEEFSYDLISRREMTRVLSFENTELPSFSESSKCVVRNEDNNFNDFFNIAFKIPQLISSSFYWVKLLHCIVPKVVRSSLPHCSTGSKTKIHHQCKWLARNQKQPTSKFPARFLT